MAIEYCQVAKSFGKATIKRQMAVRFQSTKATNPVICHWQSSNYLFNIHGNNAWVSHDDRSFAKDGAITYSHEIRILEKVKGEWKLVAQSIHLYRR